MAPNLDQITRKEAQKALRSPEELDQLMSVTRARGWITLTVIGVIITVALAWAVFGSISKTVSGEGLLLPSVDPVVLYARGAGRVLSFGAANGDRVKRGQRLLKLDDPLLSKSLAAAVKTLENLETTNERLTAGENQSLASAEKEFERKKKTLKRTIKDAERLCGLQKQQLEAENKLLKEGLIPKQQWIQSQKALAGLIEQALNGETEMQKAVLDYQQTELTIQQARDNRLLEITRAKAQVAEYETRSQSELEVLSPVDGHVLEFRVGVYGQVAAGDALVEILPLSGIADRCVAYTDAGLGKKIKTGMRALVSPSIARPERYGYIVGKVTELSEFIDSKAEILRVYESETFVANLLKSYPLPLRVTVRLLSDSRTLSGFQWTSASGLPGKISAGTICKIEVEVQRDKPIDLLIPWLKKTAGIDD